MLLQEKLKNKKLILASQSPRRKQLLAEMGLQFEVMVKSVDESFSEDLKKEQVALHIARQKAEAFDHEIDNNTIVITADTIVCLGDKILNKPTDRADAVRILQLLSGNKHTVITAVCLFSNEKEKYFFVETDVYFRPLSSEQINYYLDNYKPYDKAGSYGIQEWIGLIGLEKIVGSYHNVMGLPTAELYLELMDF
ncbi:MAG: Maf family protein [Bacteroidia bacterium]